MKVAFLTGASRGLGFAVNAMLVDRGWKVISPTRQQMDLRSNGSIETFCNKIIETVVGIDLIVNCAGVLNDMPLDMFQVNAVAPTFVIQTLSTAITEGTGRVINISSTDGLTSKYDEQRPSYSASKAALNAYTRIAAMQLGNRGIAVNAMCPGWIQTDMGGKGATKTAIQGAEDVIWLATEVDDDITGQFFHNRRSIPW